MKDANKNRGHLTLEALQALNLSAAKERATMATPRYRLEVRATVEEIHRAFEEGWNYGQRTHREATPRAADEKLRRLGLPATPCTETAFCNGSEDGVTGDRWRLDGCCKGAFEESDR